MPVRTVKSSFVAGEVSPVMNSSIEADKYQQGLATCENYMVALVDGIKNRPGLRYGGKAYNTLQKSRLIPFQFNEEQGYMLEFVDGGMRVWKDKALVLRSIRNATYKWTLSGSGSGEYHLELVAGGDPGLMAPSLLLEDSVEIPKAALGSLTPSTWNYGDNDGLGYSTIYVRLSDSTDPDSKAVDFVQVPYLIATPYPIADVGDLDGDTQAADVLYLFHGSHKPREVTRTADDAWTVTVIPDADGPYRGREKGDSDIKIKVSFVSGTLWQFDADSAIFDDIAVGDPFRVASPIPGSPEALHWTWYVVASVTSTVSIRANLQEDTRPIYQQIVNGDFKDGTTSWENLSTPLVPPFTSLISYDHAIQGIKLTDGVGGDAIIEQPVLTFSNVMQTLFVNIAALNGVTPRVVVRVGTASGLSDILLSAALTATGPYTFRLLPTQEVVYVSITSVGSTDADYIVIDRVEMWSVGDDPVGGTQFTTTDWRLPAHNANRGWPKHGAIDGQRLVMANTDTQPQTMWASELGNFLGFAFNTPTLDGDSFSLTAPTEKRNGIRALLQKDGLKAFTAGAVWRIFAPAGGVISPSNVAIEVDEASGSLELRPIVAHNAIIMTPRGSIPVLEMVSSLEAKGFASRDIGTIAEHLFKNRRIVRWAFAEDPDSVIWCILDNGQLLGITYHRRLDRWGWHKHTCPLGFGYEDVAVIPNSSDENIDDVYFVVNRSDDINAPKYFIETLDARITPSDAAFGLSASPSFYDYRFLDSFVTLDNPKIITNITEATETVITSNNHGFVQDQWIRISGVLEYDGLNGNAYFASNVTANTFKIRDAEGNFIGVPNVPGTIQSGEARAMVTTMSGLDHLEGEFVTAIGDGFAESGLLVANGTITLSKHASYVHAGIPYLSKAELLDIETIFDTGGTQGKRKSINELDIYFTESRGLDVYTTDRPAIVREVVFTDEADGDNPSPLFDGVKNVKLRSASGKQRRVVLQQSQPYPSHITRIIADVEYTG
jgi:hypothetical protein